MNDENNYFLNEQSKNALEKFEILTPAEREKVLMSILKKDYMEKVKENNELKKENENLNEKLDTYNKMTNSETHYEMSKVAKMLNYKNYGRNNLMSFLRDIGYLLSNNELKQRYVNLGHGKTIAVYNERTGETYFKPVLTTKGVDYVRRRLDEHIAETE